MQTAVIAPGGQETVNMWCDGRGKSKGGSRKDVAKKSLLISTSANLSLKMACLQTPS
jgi:hypothetical protein